MGHDLALPRLNHILRREIGPLKQTQRRVAGIAREHLPKFVVAHASDHQFAEHATEIGGRRNVAEIGRQHLRIQAKPLAVQPSAIHRAADYQQRIAVAVIGAAAAVLAHATAEFRLYDHRHPTHLAGGVELVVERGQRLRQLSDLVLIQVETGAGGAL